MRCPSCNSDHYEEDWELSENKFFIFRFMICGCCGHKVHLKTEDSNYKKQLEKEIKEDEKANSDR
jgi:hypothetical protein